MIKSLKTTPFDAIAIAAVFVVNVTFFLSPSIVNFYFAGHIDHNLGHFRDYSALIASGELPYRDFSIEYPPLTVLFLCLLAPFSADFVTFRSAFIVVMVFMSTACWLGVRSAADRQPQTPLLAAYILAVISVGPIALVSFDYLPAFFTILTLLFLCRGRPLAAGICLGTATAFKGYPAILLAPLLLASWRRHGLRPAIRAASGWAAAVAVSLLPALALDAGGLLKSITYHSERSLELGSAYSAFLLPLKFAGAEFATHFDHGSWNLTGNLLADTAARISPLILVSLVSIAWIKIFLETRNEIPSQPQTTNPPKADNPPPPLPHSPTPTHPLEPATIARFFALTTVAFLLGFKVGSPQFLLWLLPFVSLMAKGRTGWLLLALFIFTGHCQQWIFPWHWRALVYLRPLPTVVLLLEKLSLVAFFLILLLCRINNKHVNK